MTLGNRMYKKGEILRPEALSQSNYLNVIIFLEDSKLISAITEYEKKGKKEKKEVFYTLTENTAEMEVCAAVYSDYCKKLQRMFLKYSSRRFQKTLGSFIRQPLFTG